MSARAAEPDDNGITRNNTCEKRCGCTPGGQRDEVDLTVGGRGHCNEAAALKGKKNEIKINKDRSEGTRYRSYHVTLQQSSTVGKRQLRALPYC